MQLDEVLHNAHPKRNVGSARRGEPSAAKSGKPINEKKLELVEV